MWKILAISSLKWGVWKSTITQNIASWFALAGKKVVIVDTDSNWSSLKRSELRSENAPNISVFGLTGSSLKANIPNLVKDYDLVLIDWAPSHENLPQTLILADLVLSPIRPWAYDARAMQKFIEYLVQVQSIKQVQAGMILNGYDNRSIFANELIQVLKEFPLEILKSKIWNRVVYAEASVKWLSVLDMNDKKAKLEIQSLINEINSFLF